MPTTHLAANLLGFRLSLILISKYPYYRHHAQKTFTMQNFPTDYFLNTAVRLLESICYRDSNYTREERIENLHYAYTKAAHHFAQDRQQRFLKVDPRRLEGSLRTIVAMVVYSWAKVTKELMADLSIHYTYTLILDDSEDDPHPQMLTYFDDLQSGNPQKHPWWVLVNEHFPNVLRHFGPFCSLNLIRSTLDCRSAQNFLSIALQCHSLRRDL